MFALDITFVIDIMFVMDITFGIEFGFFISLAIGCLYQVRGCVGRWLGQRELDKTSTWFGLLLTPFFYLVSYDECALLVVVVVGCLFYHTNRLVARMIWNEGLTARYRVSWLLAGKPKLYLRSEISSDCMHDTRGMVCGWLGSQSGDAAGGISWVTGLRAAGEQRFTGFGLNDRLVRNRLFSGKRWVGAAFAAVRYFNRLCAYTLTTEHPSHQQESGLNYWFSFFLIGAKQTSRLNKVSAQATKTQALFRPAQYWSGQDVSIKGQRPRASIFVLRSKNLYNHP